MALIPPIYLDCVVALGIPQEGKPTHWIASGFLVGSLVRQEAAGGVYIAALATNRHVFEGHHALKVRFNPKEKAPAKEFVLPLIGNDGQMRWYAPPDLDLAITPLDTGALVRHDIRFALFGSDKHIADMKKVAELGLTEGDGVFALGFPLGLVGQERNIVIARQGCIARIRDALAGASKEFLVDLSLFPGNSGGPLVTRPELAAIAGTKAQTGSYVIGMVQGYLPYQDVARSDQTGRPRVIFEENSGLASVIPMDYIMDAIKTHAAKIGETESELSYKYTPE